MKLSIVTLFPDMLRPFFEISIVKRAQERKKVVIEYINPRDFAKDNYKTVDEAPYGGGEGMVMKVEPIYEAIQKAKTSNAKRKAASQNTKVILTSPRGMVYTQEKARGYSKLDHLILIAGHYEGVDERVSSLVDEEISLGDFVMTGGEIAVAAIVDSVVRLLPGVLKKQEATTKESFFSVSLEQLIEIVGPNDLLTRLQKNGVVSVKLLEYPHFTRPENFKEMRVPEVLLSGNHAQIGKWRIKKAFEETVKKRRDFLEGN